ncbi:MAG: AGE family epimerase/isomerase [Pirellulales bacterium]|nr:AGE family epimerase/isomerase [Pirellulales bacterium]
MLPPDRPSIRPTRRDWLKAVAADAATLPLGCFLLHAGEARGRDAVGDAKLDYREIERVLWRGVLDAWYPRCLDKEGGGFFENFSEDWTRQPADTKFIVFQARMTWTAAAVAAKYPRHRERFLSYARHGLAFLAGPMWDRRHGGFLERAAPDGRPDPNQLPWKQMYGQAFGIYGAAEAYRVTGDRKALDLAIQGFRWIDRHAHDPEAGGYFELLTGEGQPVALISEPERPPGRFGIIGRVGQKSMNAHIHILEALTALRQVWNDPVLAERLDEVFRIVRDKIVCRGGHLAMFSTRDFRPLDERSSFGHELETAFLLLEAEEVLGRHEAATVEVARRLVDHSLRFGWDAKHGGFFDEGPPDAPPVHRNKVWWAQPEAFNGLLSIARLPGQQDPRYFDTFVRTWQFFRDHFMDAHHGGCFGAVDEAGQPLPDGRAKASPWKAAYHVVRGLLFAIDELRKP